LTGFDLQSRSKTRQWNAVLVRDITSSGLIRRPSAQCHTYQGTETDKSHLATAIARSRINAGPG
jgi:hypothetical protein